MNTQPDATVTTARQNRYGWTWSILISFATALALTPVLFGTLIKPNMAPDQYNLLTIVFPVVAAVLFLVGLVFAALCAAHTTFSQAILRVMVVIAMAAALIGLLLLSQTWG